MDETYKSALRYVRRKTREEGIDAALGLQKEVGKPAELDALILCDKRGAGQQLAGQAGTTYLQQGRIMTS